MASVIRGSDDFDSGTVGITLGTAVASTSGTSIDFTGIPSWARRITVMLNGVSTNGASILLIQVGSTTITTSGYASTSSASSTGGNSIATSTSGLLLSGNGAAEGLFSGNFNLNLQTGNIWVGSSGICKLLTTQTNGGCGNCPSLGGALDRIRLTTVNGTDTFDAGSVNISWE